MVFLTEQWMLVAILSVLAVAFFIVESRKGGAALTHHEVVRLLNDDNAVVVDVRDSKEYKAGHIAEAINIPFAKIATRYTELEKHRDKTLVVVCKMGQRSAAAGKTLKEKGFTVSRLQGDMVEWQNQNLPVIKG
jgi:Rhodanese-related sulfurtransferase